MMELTVGVASGRSLPIFWLGNLRIVVRDHTATLDREDADREVVLFSDTFTNYTYPEQNKAAVEVLEAAGVYVDVFDRTPRAVGRRF